MQNQQTPSALSITPPLSPSDAPVSPPPSTPNNLLNDIFHTSHPGSLQLSPPSAHQPQSADPDSTARLRRTHNIAGYRDGVASAKGHFLQEGFDEGFSLGAEMGMRAGGILGALVGMGRAVTLGSGRRKDEARGQEQNGVEEMESGVEYCKPEQVEELEGGGQADTNARSAVQAGALYVAELLRSQLVDAESDLALQSIFGREYFDEEGIWTWQVARWRPAEDKPAPVKAAHADGAMVERPNPVESQQSTAAEADDDFTFGDVADSHPLIVKWRQIVDDSATALGLGEGMLRSFGNGGQETAIA